MNIGPAMKKISEEIEKKVNEDVKKYHITLTQSKVIIFLCHKPQFVATQKELEDWLQVSHPTTVTIVKSMKDKGIIDCYFSKEDKRMKYIKLIWGNADIYNELRKHAEDIEKQLLNGFSEDEIKIFKSFMMRSLNNIINSH